LLVVALLVDGADDVGRGLVDVVRGVDGAELVVLLAELDRVAVPELEDEDEAALDLALEAAPVVSLAEDVPEAADVPDPVVATEPEIDVRGPPLASSWTPIAGVDDANELPVNGAPISVS
jgi:hypothetical protein